MSDLIRRQDAIDVVAEGLKGTFVEYRDIAEKLIAKVPSAELEVILFGSGIKYSGTSNLPSAEPYTESQCESVQEIIRCKDCKKYSEKTHCIMWSDDMNEFCSRAERKEDE